MRKVMGSFLTCIFLLTSSFMTNNVMAEEYYENTVSRNFTFGTDYKESSVISSENTYFYISKTWDVQNAYLNLIFTQSELLINDISTLTVYLNDVPISSTRLNDKFKYNETWKVMLPKDKLKQGINQITIKSARRISNLPCTDDSNPANWIVYSKDSFVHVDFKELNTPDTLNYYPYPYLNSSDIKGNFNVVIPDNYTNDEVTAAMFVGTSFGILKKHEELHGSLSTYSGIKNKSGDNIIFITTKENAPKEIISLISSEEEKKIENEGLIKQVISPYNKEKRLLLIISKDPSILIKSARTLGNKSIISEEPNNAMFITKDMNVELPNKNQDVNMTFGDLGYDNSLMEGPFKQTMNLGVNIPKSRVLSDEAKICAKVRYSKNLNFDKSLLTIFVNGIPAGSKKLEEANADTDSLVVNIPKEVRNDIKLNIQVRFDLEMNNEYCDYTDQQTPWAFVSKDSYLDLAFVDRSDYDLKYLSYPFSKNNSINNTTIVLPDKSDTNYLQMALDISTYIGKNIEGNSGNIKVVKYSELNDDLKKENLIIIGTPRENPIIKELNDTLPIKFNKDFTAFESSSELEINPDYAREVGAIEIVTSKFNKNSGIMVMTAPNIEEIMSIGKYVDEDTLISKLEGKATLIDENGNTTSLKSESQSNTEIKENKKILSTQGKVLLISISVIGILLLVSVLVIRKKYKSK